ncbi:MAG: hypothetical protein ABR501_05350 [Pyrinomonadaceae bacterium]
MNPFSIVGQGANNKPGGTAAVEQVIMRLEKKGREATLKNDIEGEWHTMKCAACGSMALVEGTLQGEDGSLMGFQPGEAPWIKRVLAIGRRGVRAYGCLHCHYLQLAVEFNDSDREQHQQFEGEQPDVLNRINSEVEKPGD